MRHTLPRGGGTAAPRGAAPGGRHVRRSATAAGSPSGPAAPILRLEDDGSIPADNPFPASPVWAHGLRNPQGLAWDADGNMYASDHGPSGELGLCYLDELNRIERGGFDGRPAGGHDGLRALPGDGLIGKAGPDAGAILAADGQPTGRALADP